MLKPELPENETERLNELLDYEILDTTPEIDFDGLTQIATTIFETPIGLISLVDEDRVWFKSKIGLDFDQVPRDISFCTHVIKNKDILIIEDALKDERFYDNPLVLEYPKIRFYVGVPLITPKGYAIGALCIIDTKPKTIEKKQIQALKILADQTINILEINRTKRKFQLILNLKHEGYIIQNYKGEISDFNLSAVNILGLTEKELRCNTFQDARWKVIKEDGSTLNYTDYPAVITFKTGNPIKEQTIGFYNLTNELKWLNIRTQPFNIGKNGTRQVITVFSDITSQKQMLENISQIKKRLEIVLEGSGLGSWDWWLSDNRVTFDQRWCEMLGLKLEDTPQLFSTWETRVHPDDLEYCHKRIQDHLKGKTEYYETIHRLKHVDGHWVWTLARGRITERDKNNNPLRFSGTHLNITKQKEAEIEKSTTEQKLIHASRMASLGEMASGIAHEINNPLAVLYGKASQIRRSINSNSISIEKLDVDLQKIESNIERITKIISSMRSISRNSEGDPFESKTFSSIINDTMDISRERIMLKGINLQIDTSYNDPIRVRGNQISQVLLNLINNSIDALISEDYTGSEKWIKINTVQKDENTVQLIVTDSGNGIPESTVERIMEPFFSTKIPGKGTGLGLSISKAICEDHGGKLIYNKNCKNTQFIIELPKKRTN